MTRELIPSKPADSGRVTDAMVERACLAYIAADLHLLVGAVDLMREPMRSAISAALAAQGQDESNDKHERELGQLIDERDRREEIIDCLCDAVLGQGRPEWSSAYGYDDALLEVQEAMFSPPASPATQGQSKAVAWSRTGTIHDEDGRPIGQDEIEVHWGSEAPDDGWSPLYAAPPASPAGVPDGYVLVERGLQNRILHVLFSASNGRENVFATHARELSAVLAAAPSAPRGDPQ